MTTKRELTCRGLLIGTLITLIFTAANIYLGLKIGMTIASSIPAAIISMSILRALSHSHILENNIVQTQASASAAISFVFATLPAFIIMGHWQTFPFWPVFLATAAGGVAGVIFTVPLRHALIRRPDLPFPEGVACAEVLEAGFSHHSGRALRLLSIATLLSAIFTVLTSGTKWLASGFILARPLGRAIFCLQGAYSTALLGVGYLIGLRGGLAMLLGVAIAWLMAVPILSAHMMRLPDDLPIFDVATQIWAEKVRFIGAGAIAIAAIWTLVQLAPGVISGLRALASRRDEARPAAEEQDLPLKYLVLSSLIVAVALFGSFFNFLPGHGPMSVMLALGSVFLCLILSFLVAASCGYMAGLIGSSSSPISGIMIIAIIAICLLLRLAEASPFLRAHLTAANQSMIIAFTLFILTSLTASAAISNDNLQDLKTGQILGATPWKQQVALIIGCIVGAVVTPPILNLLHQAYGFLGESLVATSAAPPLAAPQATLMLSLARGIMLGRMDWTMFSIGAGIGLAMILLENFSKGKAYALPALAIGMGIYLPPDVSVTIAFGSLVAFLCVKWRSRRNQGTDAQGQTLIACGFIVGESLTGIILAITNVSAPSLLQHMPVPGPWVRQWLGGLAFLAAAFWMASLKSGADKMP
ncbi:oligopeptide transporter, OPT family [Candidatus Kirkpatrickella diaphorinae]|uniref:Oligopeptide transporter, OPT family n=1 Tax=Candidatus Kirkpatrickella diaphorinae TaxID=2984322 RepID=A0ABY6GLM4_9PROT|nr:oligopeptide transporter, OPT family [Candidatus Kirkpatrickella diaphorinae]UYH51658.1 oligopeptide transporter, OPT family [Candidatus Kirkpatrickella diaphorinae]